MTDTVIEGVKIEIKSAELKALLTERAAWHRAKHKRYLARIDAMNKLMGEERKTEADEEDDEPDKMSAANYSTKASWSQRADSSGQRAAYFQLMATFVIPDATYRLTQRDITELELASRYL